MLPSSAEPGNADLDKDAVALVAPADRTLSLATNTVGGCHTAAGSRLFTRRSGSFKIKENSKRSVGLADWVHSFEGTMIA